MDQAFKHFKLYYKFIVFYINYKGHKFLSQIPKVYESNSKKN